MMRKRSRQMVQWKPDFLDAASLCQGLQEGLHCFVLMLSPEGRVVYVSDTAAQLLGYTQDLVVGQAFEQLVHPADQRTFTSRLLWTRQSCNADMRLTAGSEKRVSVYLRLQDWSGRGKHSAADSYITVHVLGQSHLKQMMNSPCNPAGPSRALTYVCRVLRFHELWAQTEEDGRVVECVMHHALDGTILFTDSRWCRVLGYMPQELCGRSVYNFVHPKDLQMAALGHHRVLTQDKEVCSVYRVLTNSQQVEVVHTRCRLAFHPRSGQPKFILTLCTVLGKAEGRAMLERSQAEVAAVQGDPDQAWLLHDFPKVLARLTAHHAPHTTAQSPGGGAATCLSDACTSEGDLLSTAMSCYLSAPSTSTSVSPPLVHPHAHAHAHAHPPAHRHSSTSPMPSPLAATATTNTMSPPVSFQGSASSFQGPAPFRKSESTTSCQTVGLEALGVGPGGPGHAHFGVGLDSLPSSERFQGLPSGTGRGRGRGRARGRGGGRGRGRGNLNRMASVDGTAVPKRPRGRPRGSRGKAALARAMSAEATWSSDNNNSGSSADMNPAHPAWWQSGVMGAGGHAHSHSTSTVGSQSDSSDAHESQPGTPSSSLGLGSGGVFSPAAFDQPHTGLGGRGGSGMEGPRRGGGRGGQGQGQCFTINKQDLYAQTDSGLGKKDPLGSPGAKRSQTNTPSSALTAPPMYPTQGQKGAGRSPMAAATQSIFSPDDDFLKNSPKQSDFFDELWSSTSAPVQGQQTHINAQRQPSLDLERKAFRLHGVPEVTGLASKACGARGGGGGGGRVGGAGGESLPSSNRTFQRVGEGSSSHGFHISAEGNVTPKNLLGCGGGDSKGGGSGGGGNSSTGNAPPPCPPSVDQSILENILKGRMQSPMRAGRSPSTPQPTQEGRRSQPELKRLTPGASEHTARPPSGDSFADSFLGLAGCDSQPRCDTLVTAEKGKIQLPESGQVVGGWSKRELEELHIFSAQLLGKHRYLAQSLQGQGGTLSSLEACLQPPHPPAPPTLAQHLQHRLTMIKSSRDQQQEELGVLRSRLQHQIHSHLQTAPSRRLAIVPPLPRSTAPPLAPLPPDCHDDPDCAQQQPLPCSLYSGVATATCSPGGPSSCSPLPPSSAPGCGGVSSGGLGVGSSSQNALLSSSSSSSAGAPLSSSSSHMLSSSTSSVAAMASISPASVMMTSLSSSVSSPTVTAAKMCFDRGDKHRASGAPAVSQSQTLLQDLLDFDP